MAFNLFPQIDFRQMDLNYVLEVSKQAAANLDEYAADKEQVVATQAAAEQALAAAQEDIQTATNAAASASEDAQTATGAAGTATQAAASASADAETASEAAQTAQEVAESIPADYSQLSQDVVDLKSDISFVVDDVQHDFTEDTPSRWIINNDNEWYRVSEQSHARSVLFAIPAGAVYIYLTANANGSAVALLKTNVTTAGETPDYATGYDNVIRLTGRQHGKYTVGADMKYCYCMLTDSSNVDKTPELSFAIPQFDTTLSQPQKAAEAKAVGDAIDGLSNEIDGLYTINTYDYSAVTPVKFVISSSGLWQSVSSGTARSYTFAIPFGVRYVKITGAQNGGTGSVMTFLKTYNPVSGSTPDFSDGYGRDIIPPGVTRIFEVADDMAYLYVGLITSTGVDLTPTVQLLTDGTDGLYPTYVAFGASTTVGYYYDDGTAIATNPYNYPDYLGTVLRMKTYNFGVTGSGMLERKNGDDNFMDQIYTHDTELHNAKLITIHFGYGNDQYVGPTGSQVLFPIGAYDDYYPYDEEGYHPSGDAGEAEMVSKGATMMGCLNWCIKWINEKYPYAQLIIIFGSPSLNDGRTISMTAQTEGAGIAPYKLSFVDPFDNPGQSSPAYGTKQIGTELEKLRKALGIKVVNMLQDGALFSWYSTYAKDPENSDEYALFGNRGTAENPVWDSHPSPQGYLYYSRFIAGQVISLFKH